MLKNLIEKNVATANADQFISAMQFARSEAIRLNQKVTFCKSSDHQNCGGNWENGQIVIDQKQTILRTFPPIPNGDLIIWNSSLQKDAPIVFTPLGTTDGHQGSIYYCPRGSSENAVAIILLQTGRIRKSDHAADGGKITCIK